MKWGYSFRKTEVHVSEKMRREFKWKVIYKISSKNSEPPLEIIGTISGACIFSIPMWKFW